jgi:hypothetical protein
MKSLQRSLEPHLSIFYEVCKRTNSVGIVSTRDAYTMHLTMTAWRELGEPHYLKIAINAKRQMIRLTPSNDRVEAKKVVLREGSHGYKVGGTIGRLVDAGMRTGRYLYKGNNIFVHE